MTYAHISFEERGEVLWITINRPERMNSFDDATCTELAEAFEAADQMPEIGVIVLTGAGDKAVCAGGYLADLAEFDFDRARRRFPQSARIFTAIRQGVA